MRITLNIFLSMVLLLTFAFTALCEFENKNFNELLFKLPASSFDNTSEGISKNELKTLLKKSKSESWQFINQGYDILTVKCKYGNSKVTISIFDPGFLIVYTQNESATSIAFYKNSESNMLKEVKLLPVVHAEDFVKESEKYFKDISKYDSNVYFMFNPEERRIEAYLNTWMVPEFESKDVDYKIHLKWDGTRYKIIKKAK